MSEVCCLKFASDGRLVSASNDRTVRLWNIRQDRTNEPSFSLPGEPLICAPPADVHRMLTVNLTNLTFEEWDIEKGQRLRQTSIQGAEAILHHGALFDGQPLQAALMGNCIVLDFGVPPGAGRLKLLWYPPQGSGTPTWDLCATTGDGCVYAWSADSGELLYSNKVASSLFAAFPLADHKKLLLADLVGFPEVRLSSYDLQTHQTALIDEHLWTLAYGSKVSPDGRLFAYATRNGQVKVWDATAQQTKSIVKLPSAMATEFSPDSRWLAVATTDGRAQVWNPATAQLLRELTGYSAGTIKVSFSADSKSLVTHCVDGTAKIWNIATGREMMSGLPLNRLLTFHLTWTLLPPDGNSVVESAGEQAIRVVSLPTFAEIDALEKEQIKSP